MKERIVATLLVITAFFAVERFIVQPLRCSIREKEASRITQAAIEARSGSVAVALARQSLETLGECLGARPTSNCLMIAAMNFRVMGRLDDAVQTYSRVMLRERRPEIYFNLGETTELVGRRDEALRYYAEAVSFDPTYLTALSDSSLRSEVRSALQRVRPTRGNLLNNPDFALASRGEVDDVTFAETGRAPQSPASDWLVWNNDPAPTRVRRVPSTRRRGGMMLHVTTRGGSNGIGQVWGLPGTGPASVTTSAVIRVVSGDVMIGSGNSGSTQMDAVLRPSDEWQQVRAANRDCPANQTIIFSTTRQAEFYVDEVSVEARAAAARPCG